MFSLSGTIYFNAALLRTVHTHTHNTITETEPPSQQRAQWNELRGLYWLGWKGEWEMEGDSLSVCVCLSPKPIFGCPQVNHNFKPSLRNVYTSHYCYLPRITNSI